MWARIIKAVKANGYKGEETLEAVKAYVTANMDLTGDDGQPVDLDAAFKAKDDDEAAKVKTKVILSDVPEEDLALLREAKAAKAAAARGSNRPPVEAPAIHSSKAERKSFDIKASMGQTVLPDADTAETIGAWAKLAGAGPYGFDGKERCIEICRKANVSYDFSSGGFAIPEILRNDLINIKKAYNAIPQLLTPTMVASQGESFPRGDGDVTISFPGEGVAATESNPSGDQVSLKPAEMVALTTVTRLQLQRSEIDFGEFVSESMIRKCAQKTEEIFFLGYPISTYGNQTGLLGKLSAQVVAAGGTWTIGTNATNAEYHSGCVRGSGNLWSELVIGDFHKMQGRGSVMLTNPSNLKWVCSPAFFHTVMQGIAFERGGVTSTEVINGMTQYRFLGLPVVLSNAMPSTQANAQVCCYLGDFNQCTKVGYVPGEIGLETNPHLYWHQRKIGYQIALQRAWNCHDLGTANSTQPDQSVPFSFLVTAES